MRYRPLPSVTAVRTFSMSAGLAASTVTPGSTAPVVSLTSPARMACAATTRGTAATSPNNRKHLAIARMVTSWRLVASLSYQASDEHISGGHDNCQGLLNTFRQRERIVGIGAGSQQRPSERAA